MKFDAIAIGWPNHFPFSSKSQPASQEAILRQQVVLRLQRARKRRIMRSIVSLDARVRDTPSNIVSALLYTFDFQKVAA